MSAVDWPMPDQMMWSMLCQEGGPFDDYGALAHLRRPSLDMYAEAYGRWLEWLRQSEPAALTEAPVERVSMSRLRAWLASSPHLHVSSRLIFLRGLLRVLRAADPAKDWSLFTRIERNLERQVGRGNQARKSGRILSSSTLLAAGIRRATVDAEDAPTPLDRAACQRDGAMVAFLAALPLRHRSFAELRIGHSLYVAGAVITVSLPEELTKSGVPWEAELFPKAGEVVLRYLQESRPFLMSRRDQHHDYLWVGNLGGPMSYSYIGKKVPEITEGLTGVKIPPHFFRDAAATTLARESPTSAKVISPVLGHSAPGIAERHYIQAGTLEAGRDFSKLIKRLKEER